jgi:hypothetical protein
MGFRCDFVSIARVAGAEKESACAMTGFLRVVALKDDDAGTRWLEPQLLHFVVVVLPVEDVPLL